MSCAINVANLTRDAELLWTWCPSPYCCGPACACRATYSNKQTKKYDAEASVYLSYALYPLVIGYSIYSLMYKTHKSWYSWILSSLVGAVYMFGFILMCPQVRFRPPVTSGTPSHCRVHAIVPVTVALHVGPQRALLYPSVALCAVRCCVGNRPPCVPLTITVSLHGSLRYIHGCTVKVLFALVHGTSRVMVSRPWPAGLRSGISSPRRILVCPFAT
jgi:hypothetical protein